MVRSLRFIAPLVAVLTLVGCGGDDKQAASAQPATASSDVNTLLRDTFNNLSKMQSATMDLKVRIDSRTGSQGPVSARLSGPFASQGENKLPQFAFKAQLQAGGQSLDAGASYTGGKAYVSMMGTPYVVSDLVTRQFVAGYEQSLKTRRSAQGGLVLGSLGIDFTKWLPDARNEGEVRDSGADTIKISGTADVKQVIADVEKIAAKAATLPGAGGQIPRKLTAAQKRDAENAVKALTVTVYTGAEDRILRRLVVTADLKDAQSKVDAGLELDLTFTKVGEKQTIDAPSNPKPFTELLKAADAAGLSVFGSKVGGNSATPKSSGTPNNVDKYADCIEQANGNQAKARKCADLLSG